VITNVSLVTIYVTDQDAAKDFYVNVLGFEARDDISMGDGFRWVTVVHPNQPELEFTLMVPGPPLDDEAASSIRRLLDKGALSAAGLAVEDCHATYKELLAKGVTFLQEPSDRPYGTEAVMRDNSGNWLVLVEKRPYSGEDSTADDDDASRNTAAASTA
jgi:catechol 2,3-dioxygenase-like lactoylglutathione lyase family enzyme